MKIVYSGAVLSISDWLKPLWPYSLPLHAWPTFCGAGNCFGDKIVPDTIKGVNISCVCFIHDIDFAMSTDDDAGFRQANNRFLYNLVSLMNAKLSGEDLLGALIEVGLYYKAVSTIGRMHFSPTGGSWEDNKEVKNKLKRLSMAVIKHG